MEDDLQDLLDDPEEAARIRQREFNAAASEWAMQEARNMRAIADHANMKSGGLPPQTVWPSFNGIDPTVVLDTDGRPVGNPVYNTKHVPTKGKDGRDSMVEVHKHQRQGFHIVSSRDPEGPKEFHTDFGLVMQISPKDAATRQAALSPRGATNPTDEMRALVESNMARAYGRVGLEPGKVEMERRFTQSGNLMEG
jgi:hypothetical protein